MATKKTVSNTTLNKWNEDDEKRWRVVERETKFEQIDVGSWTGQAAAIVNDIETSTINAIQGTTYLEENFNSKTSTKEVFLAPPDDVTYPAFIESEELNEKTSPVDVIEKRTNLEEIHISGTTPKEATHPSVIGIEKAIDLTIPGDTIERKTTLEKIDVFGTNSAEVIERKTKIEDIHVSGTHPGGTDDNIYPVFIGPEKVIEETFPIDVAERRINSETIYISGTTPGDVIERCTNSEMMFVKKATIPDDTNNFPVVETENVNEKISPVEVTERRTNLEKIHISGTTKETTNPSGISVIGQEIVNEKTSPIEVIEKRTNRENILISGTAPDDTTIKRYSTVSVTGKENVYEETSSVQVINGKTNLETTYITETNLDDATNNAVIEPENANKETSPVELVETGKKLEKISILGPTPNDRFNATRLSVYGPEEVNEENSSVEVNEINTKRESTYLSNSASYNAMHSTLIESENVEQTSANVQRPSRHSCPPDVGQENVNQVGSDKKMLNMSLTHPGAHCLRGMDISMDFGSLQYRERREVQWINICNTAKDEMREWKLSNMRLPNLMGSNQNKPGRRNEVLLYILSGILALLLAVAFSWYFDYVPAQFEDISD